MRFQSLKAGFCWKMRYTVLLSISRDKATLLTDERSKPVASDIIPTSLVDLRGEGWLATAAERCVNRHNYAQ